MEDRPGAWLDRLAAASRRALETKGQPVTVLEGAAAIRAAALRAHYFSTHCLHDHHDLCKGICKHCPERCKCDCHKEA